MRRIVGQVDRFAIKKHIVNKARGIGDGKNTGKGGRGGQQPAERAEFNDIEGFGEEHLLGQKAVKQRHACHGARSDHRQGGGMGQVFPHAVDETHIAGAGFVVDNTGGHE